MCLQCARSGFYQLAWGVAAGMMSLTMPTGLMAQTIEPGETEISLAETELVMLEVEYGQLTQLQLVDVTKVHLAQEQLAQAEIINGQLYIRGLRQGETSMYVWHRQGLSVYNLLITGARTRPRAVLRAPVRRLSPVPGSAYGAYTTQINPYTYSEAATTERFLRQNLFLHFPASETADSAEGHWRVRGNWMARADASNLQLNSIQLPFLQANYRHPEGLLDLGDTNISHPLLALNPVPLSVKGASLSNTDPNARWSFFSGLSRAPLFLYQREEASQQVQQAAYLQGVFADYLLPDDPELPLSQNLRWIGSLTHRLSYDGTEPGMNISSGLNWNPTPFSGLSLGLGSNLAGFGTSLRGYYRHYWEGHRDWVEFSARLRSFGQNYRYPDSANQDFANLRVYSRFNNGWDASLQTSGNWSQSELQNQSFSVRLGKNLLNQSFYDYVQLNHLHWLNSQRTTFTLGHLWRSHLPLRLTAQWVRTQVSHQPDFWITQLQGQFNLVRGAYWGLSLGAQTQWFHQDPILFRQNTYLSLNGYLFENVLLRTLVGHTLQYQQALLQGWRLQSTLTWQFDPMHQLQLIGNYWQPLGADLQHNFSLLTQYTWSFGMEYAEPQGAISGKVFEDHNHNGQQESDEPPLENIRLQLGSRYTQTNGLGEYRFEHLNPGEYLLVLEPDSLPEGFRSNWAQPLQIRIDGQTEQVLIPIRQQIAVEGIVFASPLLARGLEGVRVWLDQSADHSGAMSTLTDSGGRFQFLTDPGKHRLSLDPLSIPPGFRLEQSVSQEINSSRDLRLDFVLIPEISLSGQVLDRKKIPVKGLRVQVYQQMGSQNLALSVQTDGEGRFQFFNLMPGSLSLNSNCHEEPYLLEIEDQPADLELPIWVCLQTVEKQAS